MNLLKKVSILLLVLSFTVVFANETQISEVEKATQLIKSQNFKEAEKILIPFVNKNPKSHEAMYCLAQIKLTENNYKEAISLMEKAVKFNDKESKYYVLLGGAYGTKAQDSNMFSQAFLAPKIKKSFEKAVALDAKNINARFSLMQYYLFAPSIAGGGIDKAKLQADGIGKINKAQGHIAYSTIYQKEEEFLKAEKELFMAISLEPENENFKSNLCYLYISQKKYEKAYDLMVKVIEKNPENSNALYQIGKIGAISGKHLSESESALIKYLKSDESNLNVSFDWGNYRLGMVYEKMKKTELAKKYYKEACKLNKDFKEAKKALKNLN